MLDGAAEVDIAWEVAAACIAGDDAVVVAAGARPARPPWPRRGVDRVDR